MNSKGKITLALNKTIISSLDRAFEAFTNPDEISKWFTTSARAELTIGGKYSNADGDYGEFIELEPPRKIAFTWENKGHCPGTIVDVKFVEGTDGVVEISLEHRGLKSKSDYEDMKSGWSWALDSFKSYVETGQPIAHEDWLKMRLKK
jgi:uncharacterized protein YndB with AHSA1/START domain